MTHLSRRCLDREAATRARLIGEGVPKATADAWIAAWAEQAGRDGVKRGSGYWDAERGAS